MWLNWEVPRAATTLAASSRTTRWIFWNNPYSPKIPFIFSWIADPSCDSSKESNQVQPFSVGSPHQGSVVWERWNCCLLEMSTALVSSHGSVFSNLSLNDVHDVWFHFLEHLWEDFLPEDFFRRTVNAWIKFFQKMDKPGVFDCKWENCVWKSTMPINELVPSV